MVKELMITRLSQVDTFFFFEVSKNLHCQSLVMAKPTRILENFRQIFDDFWSSRSLENVKDFRVTKGALKALSFERQKSSKILSADGVERSRPAALRPWTRTFDSACRATGKVRGRPRAP
jgi:hypothetical protein